MITFKVIPDINLFHTEKLKDPGVIKTSHQHPAHTPVSSFPYFM